MPWRRRAPGGIMPLPDDDHVRRRRTCEWITRTEALRHFATYEGPTQSQQHIKPLHWYVACRLVLEGEFHPDELIPRPPVLGDQPARWSLSSLLAGDSDRLRSHASGWFEDQERGHRHRQTGSRSRPRWELSPVATAFAPTQADTRPIALTMVDVQGDRAGEVIDTFPSSSSLQMEPFFGFLYRQYDERNVVSAPDLATRNRRIAWSPDSPALTVDLRGNVDYDFRISG